MSGAEGQLEALAAHLRTLVGEARYREAQAALADYCRALRAAAAAIPPGDPDLRRMQQAWSKLFEENRLRVLAGRAHAAARLARLPKTSPAYLQRPLPRHTWQVLG